MNVKAKKKSTTIKRVDNAAVKKYLGDEHGASARLARESKISPVIVSRYRNDINEVSLENSLRFHVATKGILDAAKVLPKFAKLLNQFKAS